MKPLSRSLTAALIVSTALAVGCGDHRTPTDQVALPIISGSWNGTFAAGPFGLRASMQLTQSGAGVVQGSLLVFPNTVQIAGTVTSTDFTFHTTGPCPTITGTLSFTESAGAVTDMSGPTTQSFAACLPGAQPVTGTLDLMPKK
jgi:hypothetical protein